MHWCLGMVSSGSTWVYNATIKVAVALDVAPQVVVQFAAAASDLEGTAGPGAYRIVKSHDVDSGGTAWLAARATTILLSVRDPRDAVTSLMLYQRQDFVDALAAVARSARYCARFADDRRTVPLRFETGFTDDPATIDRIAASFGGTLRAAERERIVAETRRSAIEAENPPTADLAHRIA